MLIKGNKIIPILRNMLSLYSLLSNVFIAIMPRRKNMNNSLTTMTELATSISGLTATTKPTSSSTAAAALSSATTATATETTITTNVLVSGTATTEAGNITTKTKTRLKFILLPPGLKATSFLTVVLLVCLETVLLSTVSNCAKTFYMHWNTTNSIFRIDNTDHIIDVNKGNVKFEFDQVNIICPQYELGTFDNETERYIIYNVSKVEYETCRITNSNPRIIAVCDKPRESLYFTITFRNFSPQPDGLEFLPGYDYYFISTSSKEDLHRRIGGRCSTNNMKVVFKVCCASNEQQQQQQSAANTTSSITVQSTKQTTSSGISINTNIEQGMNNNNQHHHHHHTSVSSSPASSSSSSSATSISHLQVPLQTQPQLNQTNNLQNTMNWPSNWNNQQLTSTAIEQQQHNQAYYPYMTSPRPTLNSAHNNDNSNNNNINNNNSNNNNNNNSNNNNNNNINHNKNSNSPSHNKPTKKTNEYDKHPNEVVKNEELTYNSCTKLLTKPSIILILTSILLILIINQLNSNNNYYNLIYYLLNINKNNNNKHNNINNKNNNNYDNNSSNNNCISNLSNIENNINKSNTVILKDNYKYNNNNNCRRTEWCLR